VSDFLIGRLGLPTAGENGVLKDRPTINFHTMSEPALTYLMPVSSIVSW